MADSAGLSLEELLAGARSYLRRGDYMIDGGKWEGFSIPDDFWEHYVVYTGEAVEERDRYNFFSCSC